jgi:hypothetical protein
MIQLSKLRQWRACLLLLLLGMISIGLGAAQLSSINQGVAGNTYLTMPYPVVIHITFGIFFNLFSPFQFVPNIRNNYPKVHKILGRLLVISAIPVVFSALWMNQYYPSYGGALKYTGILAYNVVLLGSLILAIKCVLAKDIKNHRLWMMRAMAAALGPATQRMIIIPVFMIFGEDFLTDDVIGLLIWAGLLINIAFVELVCLKNKRKGWVRKKNSSLLLD